jgi:hypothetical protein
MELAQREWEREVDFGKGLLVHVHPVRHREDQCVLAWQFAERVVLSAYEYELLEECY